MGVKLLSQMEHFQLQCELKRITLNAVLQEGTAGLEDKMTLEMAMMVKVKQVFPTLPDDIAMKLVPDLWVLHDKYIGDRLPWN